MDNIDEIPVGREMDIWVAEKFLGLEVVRPVTPIVYENDDGLHVRARGSDMKWLHCQPLVHYSTDIAAAWEVVGKLQEKGLAFMLFDGRTAWRMITIEKAGEKWYAEFYNGPMRGGGCSNTAPLAICRAAFKAMTHGK